MEIKKAMLVYQAGIANVFKVDCLNLASFGREARLLWQGTFRECIMYASGLIAAGVIVRTAACNQAGNIINAKWSENFQEQPFSDAIVILQGN